MAKTFFLSLEQVLAIHYLQIENFGGSHGIRDLSLLESAIHRPQSAFMGKDLYETIFDKTAALIHSLVLNHPFVDGNKRTATVAGAGLLYFNGWNLKVSQEELMQISLNIASKKWDIHTLSQWLKEHTKRIDLINLK